MVVAGLVVATPPHPLPVSLSPSSVVFDHQRKLREEENDDDDDLDVNIIDRSKSCILLHVPLSLSSSETALLTHLEAEDRWPGQYIDVTRAQRVGDEGIQWPRPA